jgi:Domain of unknown function (DUF5615)
MMLYLDDDSVDKLLIALLEKAGHDVFVPPEAGRQTVNDQVHLLNAILAERTLLTHNCSDFEELHSLVEGSGGHHPGIILVRQDNDRRRDMKPHDIVAAIANLIASGTPMRDELITLNHFRGRAT